MPTPQTAHVYSPSQLAFYATVLQKTYEEAGSWPGDWVEVTDQVFATYGLNPPPVGMTRGADETGQPIWVPI